MAIIPAAALLVVQERKLLLAYSSRKLAWYLPGGKVDVGESAEEAHGNMNPRASGEISELRFFSKDSYLKEPTNVIGVLMVMDELKKEGYL